MFIITRLDCDTDDNDEWSLHSFDLKVEPHSERRYQNRPAKRTRLTKTGYRLGKPATILRSYSTIHGAEVFRRRQIIG